MPQAATIDKEQAPGRTALLIIDLINDMDFDSGREMLPRTLEAARRVKALADEARIAGVPVVYVNDNNGAWHSERSKLVEHAGREEAPGRELVAMMAPEPDDYFVIKPMHSGFYATNLPVLLPKLGVDRIILTGVAADICVLFTAADAHMRAYQIWAPADCVAAAKPERTRWALEIMQVAMHAETRPTTEFSLSDWIAAAEGEASAATQ
jgi:nicotinamidase-related amidase